jgi:polysaccharide export outer membrane protein
MPLEAVVRDARHNIVLERDDIVTAIFQPNSFVVLGAAGKNEEVRFEGTGLTLSQALGRLGGLQDMRADPKGVFLFRWESAERMAGPGRNAGSRPAAPIPVVFQVDLKEPETFFAAQNFAMKNGDVIFISNSPASDLQRFVNLVASTVLPRAFGHVHRPRTVSRYSGRTSGAYCWMSRGSSGAAGSGDCRPASIACAWPISNAIAVTPRR